MLQDNELIMLLIGMGGLWFSILHRSKIKRFHGWKLLLSSFYILLCGWTATILEGFFLPNFLNNLEHISYATSAILLLAWSWQLISSSKQTL